VGRLPGLSSPGLINSTPHNAVPSNGAPGSETVEAAELVVRYSTLPDSMLDTRRYGEPRVNYNDGAPLEIVFVPREHLSFLMMA
jgi:hypothetical protein